MSPTAAIRFGWPCARPSVRRPRPARSPGRAARSPRAARSARRSRRRRRAAAPRRAAVSAPSRHPLPQRPLDDRDAEEHRAHGRGSPCARAAGRRAQRARGRTGRRRARSAGIESSGQSLAGTESGIARLTPRTARTARRSAATRRRSARRRGARKARYSRLIAAVAHRVRALRAHRGPVQVRVRAGHELPTPAQPARSPYQTPPSGPGGREMPVPELLRARERPRVAGLLPEHEREDGERSPARAPPRRAPGPRPARARP